MVTSTMPALLLLMVGPSASPFDDARSLIVEGAGLAPAVVVDEVRVACASIENTLGAAKEKRTILVSVENDADAFVRRTGRPSHNAAVFVNGSIIVGPFLEALPARDAVLRHECVHAWLFADGHRSLPRVLEESIAVTVSGQGARLPPASRLHVRDLAAVDTSLASSSSKRVDSETHYARLSVTFGPHLPREGGALRRYLHAVRAAPDWLDVPIHGQTTARHVLSIKESASSEQH